MRGTSDTVIERSPHIVLNSVTQTMPPRLHGELIWMKDKGDNEITETLRDPQCFADYWIHTYQPYQVNEMSVELGDTPNDRRPEQRK